MAFDYSGIKTFEYSTDNGSTWNDVGLLHEDSPLDEGENYAEPLADGTEIHAGVQFIANVNVVNMVTSVRTAIDAVQSAGTKVDVRLTDIAGGTRTVDDVTLIMDRAKVAGAPGTRSKTALRARKFMTGTQAGTEA